MKIEKEVLDVFVDSKEEIRRKTLYDRSLTYCYMVAFPETFSTELARECRGLIMSSEGKVLRRPFHKFFNVNEKEHTQQSLLNEKEIDSVYEKVDGSMIAPWIDSLNELHFDTKKLNMTMREKIDDLVLENIKSFTRQQLESGFQPIFELYHPDIPETNIVIEYNTPVWRLLEIREFESGDYVPHLYVNELAEEHEIQRPYRYHDLEKLKTSEIVETVKELENVEGVVIHYTDGTFAKVKCSWYLDRHHILDVFQHRHKMAQLVLDEGAIDDISAFMTPERLAKYNEFATQLHRGLHNVKNHVIKLASEFETRKDFGLSDKKSDVFSFIVFRLIGQNRDDSEVFEMTKQFISLHHVNKKLVFETLENNEVWSNNNE